MIEAPCETCNGTGLSEQPRLYAKHRATDETVPEYKERVVEALAKDPDGHFVHTIVRRSDQQLAEARNDVVQVAREIENNTHLMERVADDRAPLVWGRNPKACLNQYGRRCDFIDACSQSVDPRALPQVYTIKPRVQK